MQRVIHAEVKAGLRSGTIVRDSDTCCPKGHRLSHNTFFKVQTQGSNYKNSSRFKKSRNKDPKPAPLRGNVEKLVKKKY